MSQLNNTMEIFKLLDKSNCRECGEQTCLAFAAAVFKGKRRLDECPRLDKDMVNKYLRDQSKTVQSIEEDMADALDNFKARIASCDLPAAARRLGAAFSDGKLTVKVLGRDFTLDSKGQLSSEIHVNPWIAIPVMRYVLGSQGRAPSGKWLPFRELKNGKVRNPLFIRRCQTPLKKIADTYTDFFEDLLDIFNGKQIDDLFNSDISIVLHPLPLVPVALCYWRPEEGLASNLYLFFDSTAEENLDIESLYMIIAGFVNMFEKISLRHGVRSSNDLSN